MAVQQQKCAFIVCLIEDFLQSSEELTVQGVMQTEALVGEGGGMHFL